MSERIDRPTASGLVSATEQVCVWLVAAALVAVALFGLLVLIFACGQLAWQTATALLAWFEL